MEKRFHCERNQKISKTLYFQHKKLFYNCTSMEWQTGNAAKILTTTLFSLIMKMMGIGTVLVRLVHRLSSNSE